MRRRKVRSTPFPPAAKTAPAPLLLLSPKKRMRRARWKRKRRLARSGAVALRARRGSAYRCLLRFELAVGHAILFCEIDIAVPRRMVPTSSGWLSH